MYQPRATSALLLSVMITLLAACAEPPLAPSDSPRIARAVTPGYGTVDISGEWSFHEDAEAVFYSQVPGQGSTTYRCSTDGTYTFAQIGSTFTGSYDQIGTCTASDGSTIPNNFTGVTLTGTINGRHVRWATVDGCFLEGTLVGPSLNELRGGGRCRLQGFGTYVTSWSATR